MSKSSIEWTEETWNPVTGCTKASAGCLHCYAERMARRLQGMGMVKYADGFEVREHPDTLDIPRHWKKPRMVFVNSMGDLFHDDVSDEFIQAVFCVMSEFPQHTFQVLTKRSERLRLLSDALPWADNVWMGVSVENAGVTSRIDDLVVTGARLKFLSCEPLLGPLDNLPLDGVDWLICGGESGPGARPMAEAWVCSLRDQANRAGVPFFFKQWGGRNKKAAGRLLDGRVWDEMPDGTPAVTAMGPASSPEGIAS